MHLPKLPRLFFKTVFVAVLVLVFFGVPVAVYWLNTRGFPAGIVREAARSLGGGRIEVRIGRLTFGPFSGLTAREVTILQSDGVLLATTDRVTLSINLSALTKRKFQVDGFELVDASLRLPGTFAGVSLVFDKVNARLVVVPGAARISHARFVFEGIEFVLDGDFLHPEAFRPSGMTKNSPANEPGAPSGKSPPPDFGKIMNTFREVHFEKPPTVRLTLKGDFENGPAPQIPAFSIVAGKARWRGVVLDSLDARGAFTDGNLVLETFELLDAKGALAISGTFDTRGKILRAQFTSSMDPLPWIRSFGRESAVRELSADEPPQIDGRVSGDLSGGEPDLRVEGNARFSNFRFRDVPVGRVEIPFAWRPGAFLTRGASVAAPAVSANFDAMIKDGIARIRAEGAADPTRCMPWLDAGMQKVFKNMELPQPAQGSISLEWPLAESAKLRGSGKLRLGKAAMRGSWVDSASSDLVIADRAVTYNQLEVRVGNQTGTGTFVYDFGKKQVRLEDIRSTLDPVSILLWVDEGIANNVRPYQFVGAPSIQAGGVVDMAVPEKTNLDFEVGAPDGMRYELLGKTLPFDSVSGSVRIRGQRLRAEVRRGFIFGGAVRLDINVSLSPADKTYSLEVRADDVDFARLTNLYFDYTGSTGKLDLDFAYRADMRDQTALDGKGSLRVEDGNVFAIPILGPLSGILDGILPGTGYQTARVATADFTVRDRKISTKNMEIIGSGFSLYGEGDIFFTEDRMDMAVRINAQGAPGLVLLPFSKLFEYVSTDSARNPIWRPRHVPREIYDLLPGTQPAAASEDGTPSSASPKKPPKSPPTRRRNR